METKKVLVKKGDVAVISCPLCRKAKKMSVARYRENRKRDLRAKCSCEHIFCICLEYRKHPRKPVKLLGKCINISKHRKSQNIIIENISEGGIGFIPFNKHSVNKDDQLQLIFALNNINNTDIEAAATVRNATQSYIGCEFDTTESFRTALGFYLLS